MTVFHFLRRAWGSLKECTASIALGKSLYRCYKRKLARARSYKERFDAFLFALHWLPQHYRIFEPSADRGRSRQLKFNPAAFV